jgi:hypothetical protein
MIRLALSNPVYSALAERAPRSEWCTTRRWPSLCKGLCRACPGSLEANVRPNAQPITLREKRSNTTAK